MRFIINVLKIKTEKIILFGNSIGSIPSIHIASQVRFNSRFKALILLSPISSYVELTSIESLNVSNLPESEFMDPKIQFYDTANRIKLINCPIMVIHGLKDEYISYLKTLEMVKLLTCELKSEWYPSKGQHRNILWKYRVSFYGKVNNFLNHVNTYYNNSPIEKSSSYMIYRNTMEQAIDDEIRITMRNSQRKSNFNKKNNAITEFTIETPKQSSTTTENIKLISFDGCDFNNEDNLIFKRKETAIGDFSRDIIEEEYKYKTIKGDM